MSSEPKGALAGLRVLDLANLLPAPLVAALLGDFGADVVKVEPPEGDGLRFLGVARDGRSLPWALAGRNKRAIVLDPETDEGRALVQQLTAVADVVVVNQPQKVLARWGCTYDEIAARNPGAVVVNVSVYGTSGPYAARGGNGSLAEAFGGLTHMTGDPAGPPMLPSIPLGDVLSGITGMIGALVACLARERGNARGQYVDVAMYEPIITLMSTAMVAWEPGTPPPMRTGSRVPGGVPRNTYRTADDRWVVLSGPTDPQVARVLVVIGLDTPEAHARYGTSQARLAVADELDGLVAEWIAVRDHDTVIRAFDDARVPVTLVNDLASLVDDPHVRARGSVQMIDDPDLGTVVMPAPMPRLDATPGTIRWLGRDLGADTQAVLADWLGER
jgi:crotonobetainyl-CoA:carnitine CoA-transferase CaiB-like acyl-CoA transferase